MKLNRKNKKGFTIVELVIVIAVIGILSAILIPTFANLTTEAQKAARKQQAADAYTAYLVEATDNDYDGLYTKVDTKYTLADVALTQKAQADVVLKLSNNSWFTYDSQKGWVEAESDPWSNSTDHKSLALVCNHYEAAATDATALYQKDGNEYKAFVASGATADAANQKLSTFNNVLVYQKVVTNA